MIKTARAFLQLFSFVLIALIALPLSGWAAGPRQPNIVYLLVDDLGVRDLSCYGSEFHESPNIDRLASQGMQFSNAYASHPVCGPSRSSTMTGKFPARMNVVHVGGKIPEGETIWPKVLQRNGYATYFLGKWHMGNQSVNEHGFDVNIGGHSGGQPGSYYFPYKNPRGKEQPPGLDDGKPGDYLTDVLTDKALALMEKNGDKPFLLYMSYYNVHTPSIGKKEHVGHFKKKLESMPKVDSLFKEERVAGSYEFKALQHQRHPEFAGQIRAVDDSVGRILAKLDELGIADNTLVIFTSDQGSKYEGRYAVSCSHPYRYGKGALFEGGLRVPFIARWLSQIDAGTKNDTVTINTDVYPTMLDVAGLPKKPEQHADGISIIETFKGKTLPFDRTFYFAFPLKRILMPALAVRKGPYKLIHFPFVNATELYNVEEDISERNDLSQSDPQRTAEMFKLMTDWKPTSSILASVEEASLKNEKSQH